LKFCSKSVVYYENPKYKFAMKKLLFVFGLLLCFNFSFAQIDIYGMPPNRSYPSFIKSIHFNKTKPSFRNNLLFIQPKPMVSQYLPKKRDCYYLLASQTSICFNREINMGCHEPSNQAIVLQNENVGMVYGTNWTTVASCSPKK